MLQKEDPKRGLAIDGLNEYKQCIPWKIGLACIQSKVSSICCASGPAGQGNESLSSTNRTFILRILKIVRRIWQLQDELNGSRKDNSYLLALLIALNPGPKTERGGISIT